MGEYFVGVIILFAEFVGTNEWARGYYEFVSCVRGEDCLFKPGFLLLAKDRFIRSIGIPVRGTKVTVFGHPNLHVFAPTVGTIRFFAHGYLFAEDVETLLESEVSVGLPKPTIVLQGVVVVLHEIGSHVLVEGLIVAVGEHQVPLCTGLGDTLCERSFVGTRMVMIIMTSHVILIPKTKE